MAEQRDAEQQLEDEVERKAAAARLRLHHHPATAAAAAEAGRAAAGRGERRRRDQRAPGPPIAIAIRAIRVRLLACDLLHRAGAGLSLGDVLVGVVTGAHQRSGGDVGEARARRRPARAP